MRFFPFTPQGGWVILPPTGEHGSSRQLRPTVIAVDAIALDLLLRTDMPHLAPLAVAAHVRSPDATAVAEAAVDLTVEHVEGRLAAEQVDAILGMVDRALRGRLERRVMEHRGYRSELFQGIFEKGAAEGRAEGRVEGEASAKANDVLVVLATRGIPVSDAVRERILGCDDRTTLDLWLRRAVVARTAAAVVRTAPGNRSRATSGDRSPATPGSRSRTGSAVKRETKQARTKRSTPRRTPRG